MKDIDTKSLEYETCIICGDIIPEGRRLCPKCTKEHGTSVKKLKAGSSWSDSYAFDWFADGRVSDGYSETEERTALEMVLRKISKESEESRKALK
jgi:hypothetical protein